MTLGQNLQAARKAKGLSQETLAEKIGVSRQALGKWEKDIALPGLDNLQAAAQVLGVSVDTLLGTGCADPAPAVTLDAMRDLLAARDAEQRRRRCLWGLLGAAGAIVAVLLLVVQNMAYQRKMQSLTDSYANLQQQLGSCTAVVCYNDEIAFHLIRTLLRAGKRVPEDVAVVSFDNSYYSTFGPVGITSAGHEPHAMGRAAADALLSQLRRQPCPSVCLPWTLYPRQSG